MPASVAGEQPLQIVDAARDPHLIADRPHDVIRREHREDVEPRPAERRDFGRPHIDHAAQHPIDERRRSSRGPRRKRLTG